MQNEFIKLAQKVDAISNFLDVYKSIFLAGTGFILTASGIFIAFIWNYLSRIYGEFESFRKDESKKIDDAFMNMSRDCDRIASKMVCHDERIREIEHNSVKHEEQILSVIKICQERHDK